MNYFIPNGSIFVEHNLARNVARAAQPHFQIDIEAL